MSAVTAAPIDPLGPAVAPGRYEDELVVVQRWSGAWPRRGRGNVRTTHFDVASGSGRLVITHCVPRERIDDDLAGVIVDELFGPGWLRGSEMFERIFTGVVRSMADDALDGWELFYRNTIARLGKLGGRAADPSPDLSVHGSIEGYAPVYDRACELVLPGPVLELGCCFGFLALRLATRGHEVTASDVSAGTVRLLHTVAPRLGTRLTTLLADAARMPLDDGCAETVLVIHLLEHLDEPHGVAVIEEALRCARRRVVVAVPLEDEADESYGHVRTVTLADLRTWGRASGTPYAVSEHHGGWLVLDKT
ncbi:MAG: class I SAM-dependent methyltransferase [Actinomycetota bacterium]|nr:class I SAM-dependent methyltransferase [Actinomycetota bacterium]